MLVTEKEPSAAPSDSKLKIDFIDPLFAVAIHIGVVDGLMSEDWLKERTYPHVADFPNLAIFLSALALLALSWVGYHKSIETKPIKGDARFGLDIILLILYILLLLYYSNIVIFAILIGIIFLYTSCGTSSRCENGMTDFSITTLIGCLICFGT